MNKAGKHFIFLLLAAIIAAFSTCSVYTNISTTADAGIDFSKYHTFAWLPDQIDTSSLPYHNEIIRSNIRNYFGQSFAERGYSINLDSPDIFLRVVITGKKKEKEVVYSSSPWPYYYCRYYYGSVYYFPYEYNYYYHNIPDYCYPADYYTQKQEYLEGSISLNVFDRKKNKLVWSGTAKGDIYDPSYINESIHPSVEVIMRKYPVKPVIKRKKIENRESADVK